MINYKSSDGVTDGLTLETTRSYHLISSRFNGYNNIHRFYWPQIRGTVIQKHSYCSIDSTNGSIYPVSISIINW
ncbi:uncharacterized protein DS421_5g145780 [Arachis hypogaea]|nr:uncharacterized protein DS421_5g145780 [Arachis hypogaea]